MKLRRPCWREGQIGLDETVELQQRLVVEDDVVELLDLEAGLLQAVVRRVRREAVVVLDAREALFLRGGDDVAVR